MKFILYLLFGLGMFSLSLVAHKKYHHTTLYALAIGSVVNANYFPSTHFPIICFGLPFGIDSVIYGLFTFCVLFMLLQQGKKSAYLLAISSLVAVLFSATMELAAVLFASGSSVALWSSMGNFLASALASALGTVIAVEVIHLLKSRWNPYLCLALGMGILCLVNGLLHYPLYFLLFPQAEVWPYVASSAAGKAISIVFGIAAFKLLRLCQNNQRR